jgi:hypothetical protein
MKSVFLFISVIFLVGCSARKQVVPPTIRQVIRDSVTTSIRYIPKDTTYYVPADSLSLSVLLSQLESGKPAIKTEGKKTIIVRRVGNAIRADCHTEAYELEVKYQNKIIEIYKSHINELQKSEVKIEKYIPKAAKVMMWLGIGFVVLIIISIVLTIKSFLK